MKTWDASYTTNGFLAGLVFAQFVEGVVPAVLACLVTIPVAFVCAAYLWQLLPEWMTLGMSRWRFLFICLVLPAGLGAAWLLGHERVGEIGGGQSRRAVDPLRLNRRVLQIVP